MGRPPSVSSATIRFPDAALASAPLPASPTPLPSRSALFNGRPRSALLRLLRLLRTVAGDVQLHDHAVMHQAVDHRRRRHGVLEDCLPARKRQVARQQDAAPLVTLRQQCEQYLHLFPALLHIAQVVQDQNLVTRQTLEYAAQLQITLGQQQFLHQKTRRPELHPPTRPH